MGVGKIEDIFAHKGLTQSNHTSNNMAGVDAILEFILNHQPGLIFANLVDFNMLYGHRNDPQSFAEAMEAFDQRIPEIVEVMKDEDILIITADHGNDPTTPSTDHSRERVLILIFGSEVRPGTNIGTRESFADVAATIGELLGICYDGPGVSFARSLLAQV